jgi:ELWxxDGT repeat protein
VAFDEQLHDDEVRSSIQICSTPLLSGPISDLFPNSGDGLTTNCDAMVWMVEQQRLLTAGVNGIDGCELWVSEGFESSTQLLLDINPNGDALPGQYIGLNSVQTAYGERVFFDADDGVNGRELWVSDATVTGTKRVVANGDSIPLSSSTKVVKWGQGIVFNGANDALLWSNGVIITPVFSHPSFSPTQQQNLDTLSLGMATFATEMLHSNATHLWFSAKAGNDIEPYLLTLDAELQSWDLNPTGASRPNAPLLIEDGLIAVAEAQNGRQLVRLSNDGNISWLTTLQHQGTGNPTTHVGEYLGIHQLGNLLVFDALTSGVDPQVWSHNLSSGQTQILSTTIVAPGDWAGGLVHQQRIWFDCVAPNVAHEICSSDGTVSGTRVETDLRAGMASSNILGFASHGEHLFFLGSGQIGGIETGSTLWHLPTNGTPTLAYDPWPGVNNNSASGTYGELLLTEHHLFFISHDGIRGHEIHAWSHGERTGDWLIWS